MPGVSVRSLLTRSEEQGFKNNYDKRPAIDRAGKPIPKLNNKNNPSPLHAQMGSTPSKNVFHGKGPNLIVDVVQLILDDTAGPAW